MLRNLKIIYEFFIRICVAVLGVDKTKELDAYIRFKRKLNLKHPASLADKVAYIELHCSTKLKEFCTDKLKVREYVSRKGFNQILVPTYGSIYTQFEQINFDLLPSKFVIKATHGCRMNLVVSDKETLDMIKTKKMVNQWLKTTYGKASLEPHYENIPHRIYVEKYLGSMEEMVDYKIHCMNGVPYFILVCSNRKSEENQPIQVTLDVFDVKWNKLEVLVKHFSQDSTRKILNRPACLDEMLEISKKLSSDFDFVRVDLYEVAGKVYFSELTFSPAACVFPNFSLPFLDEMGKKLLINSK